LVCLSPDMVLLSMRSSEAESLLERAEEEELFVPLPSNYNLVYDYLRALKTALMLCDWIEEVPEDRIEKVYKAHPGDVYAVVESAEWLVYSCSQIAKLLELKEHREFLDVLRLRVKYGVKEELLKLVEIPGIGRVRARSLWKHGYRSVDDLRKASLKRLVRVPKIGVEVAKAILSYVGREVGESELREVEEKPKKRTILDYAEKRR